MRYDFDTPVDRRGTGSLKWDVGENELPMWVADMDFAAAPEVRAALQARLDQKVFGYSTVPEEWYAAYQSWWAKRHGFAIEHDWLIFCTGVVPALSAMCWRRRCAMKTAPIRSILPIWRPGSPTRKPR